jgi:hypothetical protein
VANATSLVRRTASRLLISIGTSTNSQSTTREIHNNDCGMLGMMTCSFWPKSPARPIDDLRGRDL